MMREITYRDAVREALFEEMSRQPSMVIIGEDLLPGGGAFGVHAGFAERSSARMFESPISESAIVGVALGAALAGGPAVAEIMYSDFLCVAMDEVVNQAAKIHYMTGGQTRVPLVMRSPIGMTRGIAAQHSQSLEAWFAHIPGLRVVMAATPADAKGLLKTALRGSDPVMFFDPKLLYGSKGLVSDDPELTIPFGSATVAREGRDLSIVAIGLMVSRALEAATRLAAAGIDAEVVDPRAVSPIDWDIIFASVDKTGRLLVVNEATLFGSVASEIATTVGEERFNSFDGPVLRLGAPFAPKPSTPGLEKLSYPQVEDIERVALEMLPKRRTA